MCHTANSGLPPGFYKIEIHTPQNILKFFPNLRTHNGEGNEIQVTCNRIAPNTIENQPYLEILCSYYQTRGALFRIERFFFAHIRVHSSSQTAFHIRVDTLNGSKNELVSRNVKLPRLLPNNIPIQYLR